MLLASGMTLEDLLLDDRELRRQLVMLGVTLGTKRYTGQHSTEAAHEFAERALSVVKTIEDRIILRLEQALTDSIDEAQKRGL